MVTGKVDCQGFSHHVQPGALGRTLATVLRSFGGYQHLPRCEQVVARSAKYVCVFEKLICCRRFALPCVRLKIRGIRWAIGKG